MKHLIKNLDKTMCGLPIALDVGITAYLSECNCPDCNKLEAAHVLIDSQIDNALKILRAPNKAGAN